MITTWVNVEDFLLSWPRVAQLVRALAQYASVTGSIPGLGTHKDQPMNACINEWNDKSVFLSLSQRMD